MKEREHSFYDALAAYNYGKIGHMIYCSDGCHDLVLRPDPEPQNKQNMGTPPPLPPFSPPPPILISVGEPEPVETTLFFGARVVIRHFLQPLGMIFSFYFCPIC